MIRLILLLVHTYIINLWISKKMSQPECGTFSCIPILDFNLWITVESVLDSRNAHHDYISESLDRSW